MMHMNRGFTFIELVLVIALIGILAGLAVPFWRDFFVSNQLSTLTQETVQALRRAQGYAHAGRTNSSWGVYVDDALGQITFFRGSSFEDFLLHQTPRLQPRCSVQ